MFNVFYIQTFLKVSALYDLYHKSLKTIVLKNPQNSITTYGVKKQYIVNIFSSSINSFPCYLIFVYYASKYRSEQGC